MKLLTVSVLVMVAACQKDEAKSKEKEKDKVVKPTGESMPVGAPGGMQGGVERDEGGRMSPGDQEVFAVKRNLDLGTTDLWTACSGLRTKLEDDMKADPDLATRVAKLCDHDVHVAIMKRSLEDGEKGRALHPLARPSCSPDDMFNVAMSKLVAGGTVDDASKDLEARYAKYCGN